MPPVTALGMISLALVLAAGIWLAAHLPEHVSTTPSIILVAVAAVILLFNLASIRRVPGFAWDRFMYIASRALMAYVVVAGMIAYVFLRNHTSGAPLAVMLASLVLFAVNVPVLIGFTVARYDG